MKYIFFSIFLFYCMGCEPPKPALQLAGTYQVGDYQMANHLPLGMRYFGDSVFRFEVVLDTLVLANGNNIRKLPMVTDGTLIRLFGISHDIDHISIMPVKEL